jgi:D-glycero-beta-D-manno-heptose-7-phosphate kinase
MCFNLTRKGVAKMSDGFNKGPQEQDKSRDEGRDKGESNSAGLSPAELQARIEGKKDAAPGSDPSSLSKVDIQFGQQTGKAYTWQNPGQAPGQGPAFMLKGFLQPEQDRPVHEIKNLITNFLKDTRVVDEHKLSKRELKELRTNRNRLSSAQSLPDAVRTALQLKRMYQEMKHLEEEMKARDLVLGLDPNNQIGKQLFKELERMHPHDLAIAPVTLPQTAGLSKKRLRHCINSLTGGRVIVVGDLLIDELLEGRPERISREAPVLILEHVGTELILGGAANAAANLAAIGGICHAVGVCGRDEYAQKLERLFEKAGITSALVEDPSRPTTVKTRILSSAHALRQQLLRLDRISHQLLNDEIGYRVLEKLDAAAASFSAIILSDYRGGLITDLIVSGTMEIAAARNLQVVVDAQDRFERFRGAALITPNQPDTEAAVGFKIETRDELEEAGNKLLHISGAHHMLLTRGAQGMVLFREGNMMCELPAFNRSEVFDVTGAGDTVVATMTLAVVTGASMVEAMALGNLAAGIVVKKSGTAVTSRSEMLEALENLKIPE